MNISDKIVLNDKYDFIITKSDKISIAFFQHQGGYITLTEDEFLKAIKCYEEIKKATIDLHD